MRIKEDWEKRKRRIFGVAKVVLAAAVPVLLHLNRKRNQF